MVNEECRLDLAHQNLEYVPKSLIKNYQDIVQIIDISNNRIRDVSFLEGCTKLTSIIVDHNELNSDVVFPQLPQVKLLWMNYNCLTKLYPFVERLAYSFPYLEHLSLMGNAIVPPLHEDTYYHYLQYRLFVISRLQNLLYLDDRAVTEDEKEEAFRLYRRPQEVGEKFSFTDMVIAAFSKVRQIVDPIAMGYRQDSQRPRLI
uniref:Leucine-rich repeat-containing protein c10orf11-like protein isoform x1 n=1 Tax=Triatoma infestans TaxID=30076 RepID=A0A023FA76_TRIIF